MFTRLRHFSLKLRFLTHFDKMSSLSFIQHLNPINNKMEWKIVPDEYDYNQEIATSCYSDMLHDDERNKKFGEALKKAIDKLHASKKKAHVLDIGTGTGLLSMLAVKYGADSVVACEAFLPMANCAVNILKENNFSDRINIIKSHSTSLTVGEKGDLKQKANILVSEVFDTELIGEGAIKTFNHAFEHLLEEDCIVIPSSGTVYIQVIESDLAQKWNKLEDWKLNEEAVIKIPSAIKDCPGVGAVHDIQLSEFSRNHFAILSEVIPVFRFDWAKNKKIPTNRKTKSLVKAISSGKAQVVFMWWDLKMDEEGEIVMSCAPVWEHPNTKGTLLSRAVNLPFCQLSLGELEENNMKSLAKTLPWRDHWMQAVYFFRSETLLKENEFFTLVSSHDEFSFWFEIEKPDKCLEPSRPVCECNSHFLLSRTRIGAINDTRRRNSYFEALKSLVNCETVCIVINDISFLGPLCARLNAKKVYVLSENSCVDKVYADLSVTNGLTGVLSTKSNISQIVESIRATPIDDQLDLLIVSEPHFRNSILPWDNLAFWYMKEEFVSSVQNFKGLKSVRAFPKKCKLRCCAVQFDNLWKIATPLNSCEGFSMKIFDSLIASAKDKAENYVEAQPLWEYPGIALMEVATMLEFDFNNPVPKEKLKNIGALKFGCPGRCDGVALWMEYHLNEDCTLSFGPVEDVALNQYLSWDMFERQGVHLFRNQSQVKAGDSIQYEVEFDPQEAEFNFQFLI